MMRTELETELTAYELFPSANIPDWLSGTLVRNGPVMFMVDGKEPAHWFDGLGMLHAFSFEKGRVLYSNRYLRSNAYDRVTQKGKIDYLGFATDPCRSLIRRFFTYLSPSMGESIKNANVNVTKIASDYVALTEIPLPVRFDIDTLETLGVLDFADKLPKGLSLQSAHPHRDQLKGEMISYAVKFSYPSAYEIYRIEDGSSKRELIASIPVKEPSYMHSFALTENFIVLTAFPLVVNPLDFLLKAKPFIQNYQWKPERGTELIIIDRHSGGVLGSHQTRPFFAFHHVNAYEQEGSIVMDLVVYPVFDENKKTSFLLLLDASTFKERARAEVPHKIPLGLHGQYFSR